MALLALLGCEGTEYSREAEDEPGQREVTDVTSAGAPNSERAPEGDRANATAEELLAPGAHGAYDDVEQ